MLVVTRRVNESVLIADDIVVTVTHIRGGRVRLAINAPNRIPIGRLEVGPSRRSPDAQALRPRGPVRGRSLAELTA